jgi:hypothetical protein
MRVDSSPQIDNSGFGPLSGSGDRPVTVAFVGDVAFAGPLADDPVGAARRIAPAIREALRADVLCANLECPLVNRLDPGQLAPGTMSTYAPATSALALKELGVRVVTLGNNHFLDCGPSGLAATIRALEESGIGWFGAGMDLRQASRPFLTEVRGVRIGLVGLGAWQTAKKDRPGSIPIGSPLIPGIVREARGQCDFLALYFHDGIEALNWPTRANVSFAHAAAGWGLDCIVGTHPHTVQGMETYQGVPIVYSLGNFIMHLMVPDVYEKWRSQTALTRMGIAFGKDVIARAIALRCEVRPGQPVRTEIVHLALGDDGLPAVLQGARAQEAKEFFEGISRPFAKSDDPVWRLRDDVERRYYRIHLKGISWEHVLKNLGKLRPRHLKTLWRYVKGH